jgi:hypothetical protein
VWNFYTLKVYINKLTGVIERNVNIRINNFYCDFDVKIEFMNDIDRIDDGVRNSLMILNKELF